MAASALRPPNNMFESSAYTAFLPELIYPQAVIFYDYLLTFTDEVTTIWRRKISLASVAILVNRYALLGVATSYVLSLLPMEGNPITDSVSGRDALHA